MSKSLEAKCLEDGIRRGILGIVSSRLKSAGAAGAARTSLRNRELAILGERLFRNLRHPSGPIEGLKASILPGYGQMNTVRQLIASYPTLLQNASPAERPMVKKLFRQQLQQQFSEIGGVAEPKIRLWNRTAPLAGGAAAGAGLGVAGGHAAGQVRARNDMEEELANMPLWDRMKFLLSPQHLSGRPQSQPTVSTPEDPYELRDGENGQF